MNQGSIERLREYLAQLPPQSQALLMREFERALERGEDTIVATFVLEQLRKVVRGAEEDDSTRPRTEDPARLLFRALEPFLADGDVVLAFAGRTPRTGDVVVVEHPARDGFELVKRVAGSPGEVVHVLQDGSRLMEPVALGPGEWFVVGDAHEASTDSRAFGPVSAAQVRRLADIQRATVSVLQHVNAWRR